MEQGSQSSVAGVDIALDTSVFVGDGAACAFSGVRNDPKASGATSSAVVRIVPMIADDVGS